MKVTLFLKRSFRAYKLSIAKKLALLLTCLLASPFSRNHTRVLILYLYKLKLSQVKEGKSWSPLLYQCLRRSLYTEDLGLHSYLRRELFGRLSSDDDAILEGKICTLFSRLHDNFIVKPSDDLLFEDSLRLCRHTFRECGYAFSPFLLQENEVVNSIAMTKSLLYTVRGEFDPACAASANSFSLDLDNPLGATYTHYSPSLEASIFHRDISELIFLCTLYLMGVSQLCVVRNQHWYSFPLPSTMPEAQRRRALSDAAQLWHRDNDALSWIKVFTFMTRASESTGAHAAIVGSHLHDSVPAEINKILAGHHRISDTELSTFIPLQRMLVKSNLDLSWISKLSHVVFDAYPGSILFANTMALHKGLPLESSHRLMHQYYLTVPPGSLYTSPALGSFSLHGGSQCFR